METNQIPEAPKQSNGSKVTGIIAIIIVVIGLGWYFMNKKDVTNTQTKSEGDSAMQMQHEPDQAMTMNEMMAMSKNKKCEISFSNGDKAVTKGTVYFGEGKMRGDINTTQDGKEIKSHMINDGTYMYIWVDDQPVAMKMEIPKNNDATKAPTAAPSNGGVDMSAKYNYNCSNWSPDDKVLNIPTDVKFMEQAEMMKGMPSQDTMKAQQCAACANAGDGKAQCLAMFKCN